jgi:hypothetical protein
MASRALFARTRFALALDDDDQHLDGWNVNIINEAKGAGKYDTGKR